MAELIKKTDNLNQGREKLNAAITDSEKAKADAGEAKVKSEQALAQSESTQTQLDTIVIEGDSSVEAAQARVPAEGSAYGTLKERLDSEYANVTSQLADIAINIKSFGAVGNANYYSPGERALYEDSLLTVPANDDTESIKQAVLQAVGGTLFIPKGFKFMVTESIYIPENVNVVMDSPIIFINEGTSLVIGETEKYINEGEYKLWVEKPYRNWANEENIGLKLINFNSTNLDIYTVKEFTTGAQLIGSSGGFAYNHIKLNNIRNCKYPLHLTGEKGGWCNENLYINGRFGNSSTNVQGDRYGVRIGSLDGTYNNFNNNVFIKPSFELVKPTDGSESLPILIETGRQNYFLKCRNEGNGNNVFARVMQGSSNVFDIGWEDSDSESFIEQPNISSYFNKPVPLYENENNMQHVVTQEEGALGIRASFDVSNNYTSLPNTIYGWQYNEINKRNFVRQSNVEDEYIVLNNYRYAVGTTIKLNQKRLIISPRFKDGFSGRLIIRPLDASGNLITGLTHLKYITHPYSSGELSVEYITDFNGAYRTYSASNFDRQLIFDNNVDKVDIMFSGDSSSPAKLEGFSIYTVYNTFQIDKKLNSSLVLMP